jgi:ABC-type dipeptide/oligopeptide/nickel transport system ATPase subunit
MMSQSPLRSKKQFTEKGTGKKVRHGLSASISPEKLKSRDIKDYMELVETVARVEHSRLPNHLIDASEIVNIGALTLHLLFEKYPERDFNVTYLSTAIKWAVRNELRYRYKWYSLRNTDAEVADGNEEIDAFDFEDLVNEKLDIVQMNPSFLDRSLNEGFSGGEKKRNEILQMAILEPTLSILDEIDSGLDIDALRIVSGGVNQLKRPDNATIVITHYQRLLDYIEPDYVHVMYDGKIVMSGGKELAFELEAKGYDFLDEAALIPA